MPTRRSREQPLARIRARRLLELLERLALRLRELGRHLHADAREQVAAAVPLQLRDAAALDAQQLAVRRTGRNLQRDTPVRGRNLDRRTERRLVERDRHLEHEVVPAPLVQLRRLDARDDVEVARGRAAVTRLALALQPDARSVLDARRDLDGKALRPPLAAGAVTRRARLLDDRAHAMAARTRLLQSEQAL